MILYENFVNIISNKHKTVSDEKKFTEIVEIYKHFSESDNKGILYT